MIKVGDKVKVIDQEITGTVVEDSGNLVVIEDDESEFDDNRLEFKKSELEEIKEKYNPEEPNLKKFDRDAFIKKIINDDNQGERQ